MGKENDNSARGCLIMENLFWGILTIIVFTYFLYPLVIVLLATVYGKVIKKDESYLPTVSLLIAAYNEESFIEKKIQNSLELDYPKDKLEIVVVSDGSTDLTDAIVKKYRNDGVQLFRVEGRVGKNQARNKAVLASRKEIVVFSDATALYRTNAIKKLVRNFSDNSVGMVSGQLDYSDKSNEAMSLATKLYWKYETAIKKAQSQLFSLTGSVGCINAFRRHLYHALPSNILEDFTLPLIILSQNHRVVYEGEAIALDNVTKNPEQEYRMRVRLIRGAIAGLVYSFKFLSIKKHQTAVLQLFFHKVLRWLFPILSIQLFIVNIFCFLNFDSSIVDSFMLVQFTFYFFAILGLYTHLPGLFGKIISLPTYFLVVNAASIRALYLSFTSELETVWETNIY
jgi:cellulose synthase/poly-beta-1,6-N-acetylglucosamine synthase-like glycosyltransferase